MRPDQVQLTVLMTVYNGSPFLNTAIDSILIQTYTDFSFLIVDDASTDDSLEIIRSYKDPRIQLVSLEHNVGQTAALNIGLHRATTPWIARMDADDYSAPTRFEEQMQALEADDSIRCLGSFSWIFHDDPEVIQEVVKTPLNHQEICREVSGSPIIHGSIIISREALLAVGAYDEHFRIIADVDLYDRLLPKYMAANLPKALLGVRRHRNQASNSKVAFDEAIEISCRRLATNYYSPGETSAIRANLSFAYLSRARFSIADREFPAAFQDLIRALRTAPRTIIWVSIKVFVIYNIPERHRAKLKGLLSRVRAARHLRI